MNGQIRITQNRGFCIGIRIRQGQERYYLGRNERLIFGIKKFSCNTSYMLRRSLTYEDYDQEADAYMLRLTCDETDLEAGDCFYDVALERRTGELERIIGCTPAEIVSSVVRSGSQ